MCTIGKVAIWISICSTLCIGCYSATITYGTEEGNEKAKSITIQALVTKDSTRVEFDSAPIISHGAVVGEVDGRPFEIPTPEVATYESEESSAVGTVGVIVDLAAVACALFYAFVATSFSVSW